MIRKYEIAKGEEKTYECSFCDKQHFNFREWNNCGAKWMSNAVRNL